MTCISSPMSSSRSFGGTGGPLSQAAIAVLMRASALRRYLRRDAGQPASDPSDTRRFQRVVPGRFLELTRDRHGALGHTHHGLDDGYEQYINDFERYT